MSFLDKKNSICTEELSRIMISKPAWIIRWGSLIILSIIVSGFSLSWFIRFPQKVTSQIIVSPETVNGLQADNYTSMITIPTNLGKGLEIGQKVNISLNKQNIHVPFEGKISAISRNPSETLVKVKVLLPSDFLKALKEEQGEVEEITGTAQLITKDKRLIERFFKKKSDKF